MQPIKLKAFFTAFRKRSVTIWFFKKGVNFSYKYHTVGLLEDTINQVIAHIIIASTWSVINRNKRHCNQVVGRLKIVIITKLNLTESFMLRQLDTLTHNYQLHRYNPKRKREKSQLVALILLLPGRLVASVAFCRI